MTANLLVLHPAAPSAAPADPDRLIQALTALGLLGDTFEFGGQQHFRPGENFLQLITFLGCSPVVALGEPGATGDEFCHLRLDGPYPNAQFVAGDNLKTPRCPGCGHHAEDWPALTGAWERDPAAQWRCPRCGREYAAPALRWRQCAGFGRYFIRIWGIFEGEAVPSDELLATLREVSGFDWKYFYLQRQAGPE